MNVTRSANNKPRKGRFLAAIVALAIGCAAGFAQSSSDPLKSGFQNPPWSAPARMVALDERQHHRGGHQAGSGVDAPRRHRGISELRCGLATPQVVDHRLAYMTPEWKDAFKYATTLADQFGMEEAIAGSPGWSETGGPWVPPSQGMKKYVWSETVVEGGKPFTGMLAHPPSTPARFRTSGFTK